MSENGEIYTAGKKIYTAAGSDGSDKSHLWYSSTTFYKCIQNLEYRSNYNYRTEERFFPNYAAALSCVLVYTFICWCVDYWYVLVLLCVIDVR